jgi:hypothetical protein
MEALNIRHKKVLAIFTESCFSQRTRLWKNRVRVLEWYLSFVDALKRIIRQRI